MYHRPERETPMFLKILIALAAVIAAFAAFVALQPSEYRIARSATIAAAAPDVFAQVNDFHKWEAWSPWANLDPNAKTTFEGPAAGEGAVFAWTGNSEIGQGRMTLTQSRPTEFIRIRLDFVKPMAGTSTAEFTFKPEGDRTGITWAMSGQNNFISKAICLFMNQDKMVGGYFEKGLENLKAVTEARTNGLPSAAGVPK